MKNAIKLATFTLIIFTALFFVNLNKAEATEPYSQACSDLGGELFLNSCPDGYEFEQYCKVETESSMGSYPVIVEDNYNLEVKDVYYIEEPTYEEYACCVEVQDTTPPYVSMHYPSPGVSLGESVSGRYYVMRAYAEDDYHYSGLPVEAVYFEYWNGTDWVLIGEGVKQPGLTAYDYELDTQDPLRSPVDGIVTVRARAVDASDNEAIDESLNVEFDNNPPEAVYNLMARTNTQQHDSIILNFTAPADDIFGNEAVVAYDIRYSDEEIISEADFEGATQICTLLEPSAPGTEEVCVADSLIGTSPLYFAMKSVDNHGRWSDMSDVASANLLYADIGVDSIEISKDGETSLYTAYLFDDIDVKAYVTNYGNIEDTVTVELQEKYVMKQSQQVTLLPSETKLVSFVWTPTTADTNIPVSIFAESDLGHGDDNSLNDIQTQGVDVWSVVEKISIDFYSPSEYPSANEPNPFYAWFDIYKSDTVDFYGFSATLIAEGITIEAVDCVGGLASPDMKTCTWDFTGSGTWQPYWTLSGTPGEDYDISLEAGNLGDIESSGIRNVHINGETAMPPPEEPIEPKEPVVTTRPNLITTHVQTVEQEPEPEPEPVVVETTRPNLVTTHIQTVEETETTKPKLLSADILDTRKERDLFKIFNF